LSLFHEDIQECTACHRPWKGASNGQCLQCHNFDTRPALTQETRFHEARQNCVACHKEHGLFDSTISKMDHTLLNEGLLCTQCHFDRHEGLFGENCRQCHGLQTWKVQGYRHPSEDNVNCVRCHREPQSHCDERFWNLIEGKEQESVPRRDCWRCHTIRHWRHLKMKHRICPS
jgi:hypothetical protein